MSQRISIASLFTLLVLAAVACDGPNDAPMDAAIVLPDTGPPAPDAGTDTDAGPRVLFEAPPTGSLNVARSNPVALRVPSGRVLVIGGETISDRTALDSIEEYDPEAGTFTEVATLAIPRVNHTATLMPDGRVLIVGGGSSTSNGLPAGTDATDSVVFYDPESYAFEDAAPLLHARSHHAAVLLDDGRVLVVGGAAASSAGLFQDVAEAEVFDPSTGEWTAAGTLGTPRAMARVELDADGAPVVIGGLSGSPAPIAHVERWNADTRTFSSAGDLVGPGRFYHATTRLASGRVLVVGGISAGFFVATVEALDPGAAAFVEQAPLPSARNGVALAQTDGELIALGGFSSDGGGGYLTLDDILLYDASAGAFERVGTLPLSRSGMAAVTLDSGVVLVVGGYTTGLPTDLATALLVERIDG